MSLNDVRTALTAALATVADLRVYTDAGATIDPPGVILGLPELTLEQDAAYNTPNATEATTMLYVVVSADEYAAERLSDLADAVMAAVWNATDFAVTHAVPGTYQSSSTDLPAYVLTCVGPAH